MITSSKILYNQCTQNELKSSLHEEQLTDEKMSSFLDKMSNSNDLSVLIRYFFILFFHWSVLAISNMLSHDLSIGELR